MNFGEVRRAQLTKSTLLTSMLVPLGSFKICSDAKERVGCRKQWEATSPIQSLVKLQPWFLSLRWKTCLWQNCSLGSCACIEGPALGQNTLMMMISLLVAPSGLKCVLACQGKFSLHYTAIYEPIFEFHQPQQSMEKSSEDTDSKCCMTIMHSCLLKDYS